MSHASRLRGLLLPIGVAAGLAALLAPMSDAMRPRVSVEDTVNLSASPATQSGHPRIVVTADGTVHVVWEEGANIVHRYRSAGADWSPVSIVFRQGYDPAIATDGHTVVVAFVRGKRDSGGDTEVLYKIWDNDARAWPLLPEQVQETIENIAADGQQPDVALSVDGSALWLVWIDTTWGDQRPYYARIRLSDHHVDSAEIDPHSVHAQGPAIAISPEDTVHVVWTEQSELKKTAYIAHFTRDDDSLWQADPANPYFLEVRQARSPDVSVTAGHFCLTWHEDTSRMVNGTPQPNNEIALHCDGREWNVSNSPVNSLVASLTTDDVRGQMMLWKEGGSPREIVFRQGPPPPANNSASIGDGMVDSPAIAYFGGHAFGAWVLSNGEDADVYTAHWPVAVPTATPSPTASPSATVTPTRDPFEHLYCPLVTR